MSLLILALLAGVTSSQDAPAPPQVPPPKVVSPLVVRPLPKTPPPADATVAVDSGDESIDPQRVTIFPSAGWERRARGRVTLTCLIDVHGLAERCQVASETPQGQGFGAAALGLRPTLKLAPRKGPDGQPVASTMNIALAFKPPESEDNLEDIHRLKGGHEIDGGKLRVTHNPLAMRHVTIMNNPAWIRAATFDELAQAYPSAGGGTEGFAVAHCQALRSGELTHCFVAKEDPVGRGFGTAALGLAAKFKVSPDAMRYAPHGAPVEVDIPIRFPPPGAQNDHTVTAPSWVVGLDPEIVPKLFPPEAAEKGLTTGRGVARCVVAADGALTRCAPATGDPDGLGFSEAAVKLAATLKMNLWSADAAPVVGGAVDVPIRLNLAEAR